MPAPSTPQAIPDVTEDSETGSGSGLGKSRDNGIFDQMRANDAVYCCFGSDSDGRRTAKCGSSAPRSHRDKAVLSPVVLTTKVTGRAQVTFHFKTGSLARSGAPFCSSALPSMMHR